MQRVTEYRVVLSLTVSAVGGALGLHAYPFSADAAVLALIHVVRPALYAGFTYAYGTLWFTSVFFVASIGMSFITIFVGRGGRATVTGPLPPYPAPDRREDLFLVLGEQHRRTTPARAAQPSWLSIPERGLYTGILVVGAIGSGKTSACMYPYVEQLLGYRASDPARKAAGLVLEVKGDFCQQVHDILRQRDLAAKRDVASRPADGSGPLTRSIFPRAIDARRRLHDGHRNTPRWQIVRLKRPAPVAGDIKGRGPRRRGEDWRGWRHRCRGAAACRHCAQYNDRNAGSPHGSVDRRSSDVFM
jgi:hypothetical protein